MVAKQVVAASDEEKKQDKTVEKKVSELEQSNEALLIENMELQTMVEDLQNALAHPDIMPYLVVIPYKESAAQGRELFLSVLGWMKHFQEEHQIVIVGSVSDPAILPEPSGLCRDINILSFDGDTEDPQLNVTRKLLHVIETYPEQEGFILSNDDIYPVNDFDIVDVKQLKCDGLLSDDKKVGNGYAVKRNKTHVTLRERSFPVFDYACHLPVYFNSEKLLQVIDAFDCKNTGLLLSSLYFNTVFPSRIPLRLDMEHDNLKVTVARANANMARLKELIPTKIWVNNSPVGWSLELEKIIENRLCGKR